MILGLEKYNAYDQIHDAIMFKAMDFVECYCKHLSDFYPELRINMDYDFNNCNDVYNEITGFKIKNNVKPDNMKT